MRCNRYVAHHLPYSSWRFHQNTRLIASFGGTVEPLVHSPEAVHSARIGGIGVVDDAVVEHECAHARPFAMVGGRIGSAHGCELVLRRLAPAFLTRPPQQLRFAGEVVLNTVALLILGVRSAEVEVEVAADRGCPGKRPAHAALV